MFHHVKMLADTDPLRTVRMSAFGQQHSAYAPSPDLTLSLRSCAKRLGALRKNQHYCAVRPFKLRGAVKAAYHGLNDTALKLKICRNVASEGGWAPESGGSIIAHCCSRAESTPQLPTLDIVPFPPDWHH